MHLTDEIENCLLKTKTLFHYQTMIIKTKIFSVKQRHNIYTNNVFISKWSLTEYELFLAKCTSFFYILSSVNQ